MKKLIIALAVVMVTAASYGQGAVVFNTRVGTEVNARVFFADGVTPVTGSEWTAQLYGGPVGGALAPLLPSTTFRTGNAAGWVNAVDVTVPGVLPGAQATFVMRAFTGGSFESSPAFGSSDPINITVGGGTLPPTNLTGLQGFTVVPEPSTYALAALGLGALVLFRRRK